MTDYPHTLHEKRSSRTKAGPTSGYPVTRVDKAPKDNYYVAQSGCWIWGGAKSKQGYGTTRYGGRHVGAHRAFYAHYVGDIPAGMVVMHLCDQPSCVNPEHLRLAEHSENQLDMHKKGRTGGAPKRQGEGHHNTTLTEEDVREIRRLRAETGMLHRELAERFNTSKGTIQGILCGRHWSHVK